jgi:excisionase family DNA binding protein
MTDIKDFPDVPGYISIKQAAKLLGITDKRVYRYIDIGRLPAYKSGGVFFLSEEDVKNFKLNPPGRTRTGPPVWRVHNARSRVLATDIYVQVRSGQQGKLVEKLKAIQRADRHIFPGTVARYVVKGNPELTTVHFFFVWRDIELPDDITSKYDFSAFQEELTDVLDWATAQYSTNVMIIHT